MELYYFVHNLNDAFLAYGGNPVPLAMFIAPIITVLQRKFEDTKNEFVCSNAHGILF